MSKSKGRPNARLGVCELAFYSQSLAVEDVKQVKDFTLLRLEPTKISALSLT